MILVVDEFQYMLDNENIKEIQAGGKFDLFCHQMNQSFFVINQTTTTFWVQPIFAGIVIPMKIPEAGRSGVSCTLIQPQLLTPTQIFEVVDHCVARSDLSTVPESNKEWRLNQSLVLALIDFGGIARTLSMFMGSLSDERKARTWNSFGQQGKNLDVSGPVAAIGETARKLYNFNGASVPNATFHRALCLGVTGLKFVGKIFDLGNLDLMALLLLFESNEKDARVMVPISLKKDRGVVVVQNSPQAPFADSFAVFGDVLICLQCKYTSPHAELSLKEIQSEIVKNQVKKGFRKVVTVILSNRFPHDFDESGS